MVPIPTRLQYRILQVPDRTSGIPAAERNDARPVPCAVELNLLQRPASHRDRVEVKLLLSF